MSKGPFDDLNQGLKTLEALGQLGLAALEQVTNPEVQDRRRVDEAVRRFRAGAPLSVRDRLGRKDRAAFHQRVSHKPYRLLEHRDGPRLLEELLEGAAKPATKLRWTLALVRHDLGVGDGPGQVVGATLRESLARRATRPGHESFVLDSLASSERPALPALTFDADAAELLLAPLLAGTARRRGDPGAKILAIHLGDGRADPFARAWRLLRGFDEPLERGGRALHWWSKQTGSPWSVPWASDADLDAIGELLCALRHSLDVNVRGSGERFFDQLVAVQGDSARLDPAPRGDVADVEEALRDLTAEDVRERFASGPARLRFDRTVTRQERLAGLLDAPGIEALLDAIHESPSDEQSRRGALQGLAYLRLGLADGLVTGDALAHFLEGDVEADDVLAFLLWETPRRRGMPDPNLVHPFRPDLRIDADAAARLVELATDAVRRRTPNAGGLLARALRCDPSEHPLERGYEILQQCNAGASGVLGFLSWWHGRSHEPTPWNSLWDSDRDLDAVGALLRTLLDHPSSKAAATRMGKALVVTQKRRPGAERFLQGL